MIPTNPLLRIIAWPASKNRERNPYNHLLYSHMKGVRVDEFSVERLLRNRYDVWHIHWPESFLNFEATAVTAALKSQAILNLMDFAHRRGSKIIWTVHNLATHEGRFPKLERWLWAAFLSRIDGYISLSESGLIAAQQKFPQLRNLPTYVVPHGHYRGEYPTGGDSDRRRCLGIARNAKVVLFFGTIRDYKNVPELIRAFRGLPDPESVLCIAGQAFQDSEALVQKAAAGDARIRVHLRYIPAEEVQNFFGASNLVVLPYREILNSGTALLALSFNKPVLVPRKGAMSELQTLAGSNWVRTYPGSLGTPELAEALRWATEEHIPGVAPLDCLDWSRIAEGTVSAYQKVVARNGLGGDVLNGALPETKVRALQAAAHGKSGSGREPGPR